MRVGLYVDMRNPPHRFQPWQSHYGRWLERFEEVERLGGEAIWLTEHHFFDDGYLPQCWTLAAAIAARTSRVRIGSAVTLLPLHSTIELAEQIALVDIISSGRAEPGFGVGYRKPEYLAFGGDFKRRYRVFAERIAELRKLWGEEPGAAQAVTPPPIQRPMPMWAGFGGPMGARIAGRLGLGLQSLDAAIYDEYRRALIDAGHEPGTARVAGHVELLVSDDPERTWAEIGDHVLYRWRSYHRYMFEGTRLERDSPAAPDPAEVRRRFLIGTPEEVASAIHHRVDGLPVTDLFVWADYPGIPDEMVDRHLELTFSRVAPLLRG